jgi:CHAT domain-containing protein
LHGHALVAKAAASMGIQNQDKILPLLDKAVRTLTSAGTPGDTVRPLYYLAFTHSLAGDSETSLSMTYRGLRVTSAEDHVRLAQFYYLASLQVYRLGFARYALPLANQAVVEAVASPNPGVVATVIPLLATIQTDDGHYETAENYLAKATAARDLMKSPQDRETLDLVINLLCGRIKIATKRFEEAQKCLTDNLNILKLQDPPAPDVYSQTLMLLAQLSLSNGRVDEARKHLRQATEVIEQNDEYFATAALRMSFENQRRNLYDVAIGVEYDHAGKDTAWGYLQRYRSKLFLEFLRQMNPGVAGILVKAVDRNKVQQLIPDNLQTLEYVMLKDRLVIWLVSRDKFISESVDIRREDLEKKVSGFLKRIIAKADVQASAEELYNLLIDPIASDLDPNRSLAIIPDQALHRLNFAALRSPESRSFLIEQFPIVESPNLTTLLSGGFKTPSRGPAIGFGTLKDNTGATDELRRLKDSYPDIETIDRQEAVKPAFLSAMERASIFHFAGHSQDAADPLRSSILLDGEREGPNSVTAVDISRHRMPANSVVILASCDSSVGNSRDGIGIRGLTSAFLISGAGSVVGSLWPVEAKSTSQLVVDFHENFATNYLSVATSLRNAQLALIKSGKFQHPYYWSGFVVTGNTTAFRQVRPAASN